MADSVIGLFNIGLLSVYCELPAFFIWYWQNHIIIAAFVII
ncbi:hypothetical protein CGLO_18274 [Colletotrichum gloeosporioides Cg-14]|uniref:Uncharacterized protein n=1 Tax=Colletotrichum gloeosporioides (strain Cg-14) TaxID=1237896 RepID=T0JUV1_COLGC|nr:hypothetical protein CGLO_18274 [Colletotrichum gloeosporioides Cg-14]